MSVMGVSSVNFRGSEGARSIRMVPPNPPSDDNHNSDDIVESLNAIAEQLSLANKINLGLVMVQNPNAKPPKPRAEVGYVKHNSK